MDIDNEHLGIPDQKYSCVIDMPAAEFQRTCRDISSFSDTLTISATKAGVVFSGKGGLLKAVGSCCFAPLSFTTLLLFA